MSRYLTPAKIGLLALISIYVDSRVPIPATVPLLSFLVNSIIKRDAAEHDAEDASVVRSVAPFQSFLGEHASVIPGRSLWDLFIQQLWSISSLDALHVFFASATALLEKSRDERLDTSAATATTTRIKLSRNSPLGIFVRRAYLEFTRLQLHDGIDLWNDLVAFREPTYGTWKKRHPMDVPRGSVAENSRDLTVDPRLNAFLYGDPRPTASNPVASSTEDVDRVLGAQVAQMQKTGQRVPANLRRSIEAMLSANASASSLTHYSSFLDAWRAGDCTSAFDNLHRYFDYTMHISGRNYYHYALLSMAFLHADFGCLADALAAIRESISMARENNDMACLNYSLSWLYSFGKKHPEEMGEIQKTGVLGTDREALAFIKAKAKDAESWSLLSTCLLAEAELTLSSGGSLALAFENIARAMYLNHTKGVHVSIGQQMITQSSLYARLGLSYLEWSDGDLFHQSYAKDALAQDRIEAACRSAIRLARRGRFEAALALMQNVDPEMLRVVKLKETWVNSTLLLKLRRAVYTNDTSAARHYLSQSKASLSRGDSTAFETQLCGIDFAMRQGEYSAALTALESLLASPSVANGDIHDRLLLMTVKAQIYDQAGVAPKGFSLAVRAASAAYRSRNLDVLFRAVGALCRVLLSVREFAAASELMRSIMPHVLECEDGELAATAFLTLADAHMGAAGAAPAASAKRKEHMTTALGELERAFDAFASIGDVRGQSETMAKRALIMRITHDLVLANDYAAKALDIRRAAKAAAEG